MEGSESDKIYDSINLNPQLFINQVLNDVDGLSDEAFAYYHQEASNVLLSQNTSTDKSDDLTKGVYNIREIVESVLHKQLAKWEQYCLHHCFKVPEGLSLSKPDDFSKNISISQDGFSNPDLDAQLESLRSKLTTAGRESDALTRELRTLEQQLVSKDHFAGLLNEALQIYDQNSFHGMFEEMTRMAPELKMRTEMLMTKNTEVKVPKTESCTLNEDLSLSMIRKGFSDVTLDSLEEFSVNLKNM